MYLNYTTTHCNFDYDKNVLRSGYCSYNRKPVLPTFEPYPTFPAFCSILLYPFLCDLVSSCRSSLKHSRPSILGLLQPSRLPNFFRIHEVWVAPSDFRKQERESYGKRRRRSQKFVPYKYVEKECGPAPAIQHPKKTVQKQSAIRLRYKAARE